MKRSEFDDFKTNIEGLDNLYKVLEEIDSICNLENIEIVGDEGVTKISMDKEMGKEIHDIFRNVIRDKIKILEIKIELIKLAVPSIIRSIQSNYFDALENKKWAHTYWFIDIHGTVLFPTYDNNGICTKFYPLAKEVLQMLSIIPTIKLVMYSLK